jgi:hypothetical protein
MWRELRPFVILIVILTLAIVGLDMIPRETDTNYATDAALRVVQSLGSIIVGGVIVVVFCLGMTRIRM